MSAPTAAELPVTRAMLGEVRVELLERIDQSKSELRADIQQVKGELRAEIQELRGEVQQVKSGWSNAWTRSRTWFEGSPRRARLVDAHACGARAWARTAYGLN